MKYKREVGLLLLKAIELNRITTPTGHSVDFKIGFETAMTCAVEHILQDALGFVQEENRRAPITLDSVFGAPDAPDAPKESTEHTNDFKGNEKTIV